MGWWSSSSSSPKPNASDALSGQSTSIPSSQPISKPAQPKGITQEEELAEFMPIFASSKQSQTTTQSTIQPSPTISSTTTSAPSPTNVASDSIAPFPTTMSCRQAFDNAFYCQSLGGQFNNVYRYGSLKDCSEHWSEFWFCMRTKNKSDESKSELIQEWYKKKEDKYRTGPSSEDVWTERKVRLERAFDMDPDEAGFLEDRDSRKTT